VPLSSLSARVECLRVSLHALELELELENTIKRATGRQMLGPAGNEVIMLSSNEVNMLDEKLFFYDFDSYISSIRLLKNEKSVKYLQCYDALFNTPGASNTLIC